MIYSSLLLLRREVLGPPFCGLKLEAALKVLEDIGSRAWGNVSSVRSSFQHRSAADWQSVCAPLFSASPLVAGPMQRRFTARTWAVGPCLICQVTVGGQVLRRTLEHVSVLSKFVVLTRYIDGHVAGATEGVPFDARPGNLVLRDFSRSFEALQYPSIMELVVIPRRVLGIHEADIPALRVMHETAREAIPLQKALSETFCSLTSASGSFSMSVLERLLACTRAVLSEPPYPYSARQSARAAQRAAIDRFIEENLARLDLSAETILPQFGVSRATLYRLFEEDGGVRKYIVDRRLFRALLEISTGGARRGVIQHAAKRWGFSSAANFNRSVRHAFGGTPGSLFKEQAVALSGNGRDVSVPADLGHERWMSFHP